MNQPPQPPKQAITPESQAKMELELQKFYAKTQKKKTDIEKIEKATVYFASGTWKLSAEGQKTLDKLKVTEGQKVSLYGYTDSVGNARYNWLLSQRRALTVKRYLQKKQSKATYKIIGRGETRPQSTNATARGRGLNRRVLVIVSSTKTEQKSQ